MYDINKIQQNWTYLQSIVLIHLAVYCVSRCYDPTYRISAVSGVCEPVPDCSVDHCYHGDCVIVDNSFFCNCYEGWTSKYCNETGPTTEAGTGGSDVHPAAYIVPIIVGIILLRECHLHFKLYLKISTSTKYNKLFGSFPV